MWSWSTHLYSYFSYNSQWKLCLKSTGCSVFMVMNIQIHNFTIHWHVHMLVINTMHENASILHPQSKRVVWNLSEKLYMHKHLSLLWNFDCIIYPKIGFLIVNRLFFLTIKTFIVANYGISNCNIFNYVFILRNI
jgi:hypothetical protein